MKCWIFDIDGTLADGSKRQHYLVGKKDWKSWYAEMGEDTVHEDIKAFYIYAMDMNIPVIVCTGREETHRQVTETWLKNNGIFVDEVYMRREKDYRDDDIIKKEMLDEIRAKGYNPVLVFEDRDRVVKMWRNNGIRCLQVAEGNF